MTVFSPSGKRGNERANAGKNTWQKRSFDHLVSTGLAAAADLAMLRRLMCGALARAPAAR
jgi:hypothetical protein